MEAVEVIQNNFNNEIQSLATVRGPQRRHMVHQVVRKDAQKMKQILNDKQFDTYMRLLVTTLRNKHLEPKGKKTKIREAQYPPAFCIPLFDSLTFVSVLYLSEGKGQPEWYH